jgi:hypothetical protein
MQAVCAGAAFLLLVRKVYFLFYILLGIRFLAGLQDSRPNDSRVPDTSCRQQERQAIFARYMSSAPAQNQHFD